MRAWRSGRAHASPQLPSPVAARSIYEITCRELIASPDKLRETSLKLAKDDVQAKVRYEQEIERICADAPEGFRPVQRVKPEE